MWAVTGIWNNIVAIATSTEIAMLIVAVLIVIAAGLVMRGYGMIGSATTLGLIVFALANYAQGVALQSESALASAGTAWQKLLDMQAGMLIAYFLSFGVLISLVYFVRSLLFPR